MKYFFWGVVALVMVLTIYLALFNQPVSAPVVTTPTTTPATNTPPVEETPEVVIPDDIADHIASKADLIRLESPAPLTDISSPLALRGQARGYWFFEATFPITLVNWDGLIIAEGYATADGEWMTEDFVPFTAQLTFDSPYKAGDPDFMRRGAIILQKDNPSGLPENDDALEIPVWFEAASN